MIRERIGEGVGTRSLHRMASGRTGALPPQGPTTGFRSFGQVIDGVCANGSHRSTVVPKFSVLAIERRPFRFSSI